VLSQTRVGSVIIFEGVNDIGVAAPDAASQAAITARVIAAFKQIATRVHAQDKPIYGATITPFGGNTYDAPEREKSRQAINAFIRTSGTFDAVIDFDAAIRNPKNISQIDPQYGSVDGLHPGVSGYYKMAQSIDLALFP
jgi:lysophospholipase L1-like esterase